MRVVTVLCCFLFAAIGCQSPAKMETVAFPGSPFSYRVESYNGPGATAPTRTAIFAVFQNSEGKDESLVLSGTYLGVKSIVWQNQNEGFICLVGGYTQTYKRIVPLTIGHDTRPVYTHISDQCR
jgi:hypothetical protein